MTLKEVMSHYGRLCKIYYSSNIGILVTGGYDARRVGRMEKRIQKQEREDLSLVLRCVRGRKLARL